MPAIKNDSPRKPAPSAHVSRPYSDPRVTLVENAKAKLGAKAKGMTFFFGDRMKAEAGDYAELGYIPVRLPDKKDQEKHGGDPLFMRPEQFLQEHLEDAASTSSAMAEAAKEGELDKYKTVTGDGTTIGPIPDKEE